MIRYGHITLQDLTWVYLGRSKFFIELAASFRPLPATSKSQNTPFWAKNSLFWSGSHQFSFLNTFTIWYGFISLRTQINMYMRWSKNFMETPAPFRPLWATPKSKYSIHFSCFSSNFVKISKFCIVANFCRTEALSIWKSIYFWQKIRCYKI